jgi:F-type H+-transporting ATPase subunit delta
MSASAKQIKALARQLFRLSLDKGLVSAERVEGVLAYVEKHKPARPVAVLKAYERMIAAELSRSEALVEHAGAVPAAALASISDFLSKKYSRKITAVSRPNPSLIAGLRVHIGDDIYESSVAGQLDALAASL